MPPKEITDELWNGTTIGEDDDVAAPEGDDVPTLSSIVAADGVAGSGSVAERTIEDEPEVLRDNKLLKREGALGAAPFVADGAAVPVEPGMIPEAPACCCCCCEGITRRSDTIVSSILLSPVTFLSAESLACMYLASVSNL
jgi:hypothetical protein